MADFSELSIVATELEKVRPKVATAFDRDDTFYSTIEKRPVEVISARDMRIPIELRPGGNPGHFNPEGGSLGPGSGPFFDKAVIGAVYLKYGVSYTKKAEWASDSGRKAVVNATRHLLATSMAEFRRFVDSLCMTGGNGIVGTISAVSTAGGKDTYTLATDGFGSRLIRYAQFLAVYLANLSASRVITPSAGDALDGIAAEVDFVDPAAKQIRIKGTAAGPAIPTDVLVVNGLSGASPVSMLGVPYHQATTGTWLGLDRALVPEVRANNVDASTAALALSHARLAVNKIGDRIGRDQVGKLVAWAHPCQAHAYEELGQATFAINKQAKAEGLNLYFGDDMVLAGVPLKTHFSWDKRRIDILDMSLWGRAEVHPAGFYEEGGKRIFEGRDQFGNVKASASFFIACAMNLFNINPIGGAFISGLAIPTGY